MIKCLRQSIPILIILLYFYLNSMNNSIVLLKFLPFSVRFDWSIKKNKFFNEYESRNYFFPNRRYRNIHKSSLRKEYPTLEKNKYF